MLALIKHFNSFSRGEDPANTKYASLLDMIKLHYLFKYLGKRGLYEGKINNLNCV